jgi:hypothetical protein
MHCSRFALRNAGLMFHAKHPSRRPEVGDYNFTLGVADSAVALNRQLALAT